MIVDPLHPQWFTFKPEKMLADETYRSQRKEPKSDALLEIERRQQAREAEKLRAEMEDAEKVVRGKFPVSQR